MKKILLALLIGLSINASGQTVKSITVNYNDKSIKINLDSLYEANKPIVIAQPISNVINITYAEFASLSNVTGKNYKVKAGIYNQTAYNQNLKDCTFDLTGVTIQGCRNAIVVYNGSINVSYKGATVKDVTDYQFKVADGDKIWYTGLEGSYVDRLTIDGFTFDGGDGHAFQSNGNLVNGKNNGVVKGLKIINSTFKNNSSGDIIYVGAGVDCVFENLTFDNINATNNYHNGLIKLNGNLTANKIKATNYQGQVVRNWLYSIEGSKTTSVTNVIGYNNRKYSLIELQLQPDLVANGAKVANAYIANNTAINLNTTKDWDGQLLDLYNIGTETQKPTLTYINNIGANLVGTKPVTDMINRMNNGDWNNEINSGNIYKQTWQEAVYDLVTFKSKFLNIGAN